eukprot:TRINITY_DN3283_c0_g1_i1.p1 TRINITY_DN3283_c0_g1~~TRINITY_DN3283_c0_g1_i1.p1  ORF type:complete len:384 (+),score=110.13 TRINITY_DN3283_c0_g1_i1:56-1153(+)
MSSSYESKKIKIVVSMGCVGMFLLGCLAYTLGGASQQAKDMVVHNNLLDVVNNLKERISACNSKMERNDDTTTSDFLRGDNENIHASLFRLESNRDIADQERQACFDKRDALADLQHSETQDNWVAARRTIQKEIDEMQHIIDHIRDEKDANRTSLRLKIRVFRQENKRLSEILKKRKQETEEQASRLREIKRSDQLAADAIGIGERHEGDFQPTGRTRELVKSISRLDDKGRDAIYSSYESSDPEDEDDYVNNERKERPGQIRRRRLATERRIREEHAEEIRARRAEEEQKAQITEEQQRQMRRRRRQRLQQEAQEEQQRQDDERVAARRRRKRIQEEQAEEPAPRRRNQDEEAPVPRRRRRQQ